MENFVEILKLIHIISFVFMAFPLFNLIVVNERALMGTTFNYGIDRYMENIIRRGALRCYVFQTSVFLSGILLLVFGDLGIESLWQNWIVLVKTLMLLMLMGLLSFVHFSLQPKIETLMAQVDFDTQPPENFSAQLKPYRVRRKQLATFCLFAVITIIILGLQVYSAFSLLLNIGLIALAGLFAWRVSKTGVKLGWF